MTEFATQPERVERHGGQWAVYWGPFRLELSRVHENHDDVVASLVIARGGSEGWRHVIGPMRLNLTSPEAQDRAGTAVGKRVPGVPWGQMFISAVSIVYAQWSAEPTAVRADDAVASAGPLRWLLPGLVLEHETSIIYGDGASAKSLIGLLIAICAAAGIAPPWGGPPLPRTNVVYADWETSQVVWARRVARLCHGLGIKPPRALRYMGSPQDPNGQVLRFLPQEVENLRAFISREQIGLAVADSAGWMMGGRMSDDDVARQAISDLRTLGSHTTRLLIHHISRESALRTGPQQRIDPYGSIYWRNGMRSGFEVRKSEEYSQPSRMHVGVFQHKNNDAVLVDPFALRITFDGTDGRICFERAPIFEVPDLGNRAPLQQQILEALAKHGPSDYKKIAFLLGRAENPESVRKTLADKLLREGLVRIVRQGIPGQPAVWDLPASPGVPDIPEPFRRVFEDDDRDPDPGPEEA